MEFYTYKNSAPNSMSNYAWIICLRDFVNMEHDGEYSKNYLESATNLRLDVFIVVVYISGFNRNETDLSWILWHNFRFRLRSFDWIGGSTVVWLHCCFSFSGSPTLHMNIPSSSRNYKLGARETAKGS